MTAPPASRMDGRPRVLVLSSASFNRVHGSGITLSNLFQGWPRDRLAMIHCDHVPASAELCDTVYPLTGDQVRRVGPFLGMRPLDAQVRASGISAAATAVRRAVFGNMPPDSGRLTADLERWIDAFRPDVLYTMLGSNSMMDLSLAVCDRFSTKLAVHFLDDWPADAYRGGLLSFVVRRRMRRLLAATIARADLRMGISPAMCGAYEARYGHPFVPFMNAVDTSRFAPRPASPNGADATAEILYVGSIHPRAQLHGLIDASHAAALLRDRGVRFTILTSAVYLTRARELLALAPNITVAESPTDDLEFIRLVQAASVLLLPVHFDRKSVILMRYSLPTKLPAYMASGTPILAYGPAEVAQIAYARAEGWAHVVSERSVRALSEAMARLLDDDALRTEVATKAVALASARHSLASVRQAFQRTIANLA